MALHESAEMYLETIFTLAQNSNTVRSIDIAEAMGYTKPSVSRAVGLLKRDGYLATDKDGFLVLTTAGHAVAEKIYERHHVLTAALQALGVDQDTAAEDACRMEHVISDSTFAAIKEHLNR